MKVKPLLFGAGAAALALAGGWLLYLLAAAPDAGSAVQGMGPGTPPTPLPAPAPPALPLRATILRTEVPPARVEAAHKPAEDTSALPDSSAEPDTPEARPARAMNPRARTAN